MMSLLFLIYWVSAAFLAYVFIIYPGLMACIGGLSRASATPSTQRSHRQPAVSLVIPVHNEQTVIAAKLRNAASIEYDGSHVEVIVVSDGSDDETVAIASKTEIADLRVIDAPRAGKATALNRGVAEASGEIVCFSDANVQLSPTAIARLIEPFADSLVGAVTGDVRLESEQSDFGAGESLFYQIERAVQRGESRVGSVIGVDGGMYAIRRSLFRDVPSDTILDDFAVSMEIIRKGFRIRYEHSAWAVETATPTSRAEFQRRVRVSAGAIQSIKRKIFPPLTHPVELWQYLSHKLLRWCAPYLLLSLLASNILLVREHVFYLATLVVQIMGYSSALAATLFVPLRRWQLLGIPYYFVLSHVAMIVGHVRGFLNRQPVTWARTERIPAERA